MYGANFKHDCLDNVRQKRALTKVNGKEEEAEREKIEAPDIKRK